MYCRNIDGNVLNDCYSRMHLIKKLLTITVLAVVMMFIMMCMLNRSKPNVVKYIIKKDLKASDNVVVHSDSLEHETKISEVSSIHVNERRGRKNGNCPLSSHNFKIILQPLNSKLLMGEKKKYSNVSVEQPVKTSQQRNCSSLSYISPAGSLTALASFPGCGNTWVRHLLQQATGKY